MIVRQSSLIIGCSSFSRMGPLVIETDTGMAIDRDQFHRQLHDLICSGIFHYELWWEPAAAFSELMDTPMMAFLLGLRQAYDFTFSVQLPYLEQDIADVDPAQARQAAQIYARIIERTLPLNCTHYALRVGQRMLPSLNAELRGSSVMERAYWGRLMETARASVEILQRVVAPGRLALEIDGSIPAQYLDEIVEHLGVSVCLDASAAITMPEDLLDLYRQFRSRITAVHLYDAIRRGGNIVDHQPLGSGMVEWIPLLRLLQLTSFSGPVILEIGSLQGSGFHCSGFAKRANTIRSYARSTSIMCEVGQLHGPNGLE